jgi:ATP-binding cassette subfamily F protein 3
MTLISASNLAKSYGDVDIFSAISLSIPPRSRIAIVGSNGIGKTTLLRILIGLEEPSEGTIRRARRLEIGYLPQEALLSGMHTLWEECIKALSGLLAMEAELIQLERDMSNPQKAEEALARYGPLQETFERQGGYTYETRIRQTLTGLGFDSRDYHRPIQQLSGGQRTRAVLARLLLSDPDLLILDEPTNHLDITAVEWLEGYLSQWEGAVLLVSHDRYFLDKVVDHIWEMSTSGMEIYRGNYSAYIGQRQQRWELRQKRFSTEKERLLKELDYVKRNIAGQRTQQAKGKLRRLSRQVQAIEKLGVEALQDASWGEISEKIVLSTNPMRVDEVERRIKALRSSRNRPPNLHINIKSHRRSGDLVLRTYDVDIGYQDDGRPLFHVPDLLLRRGECAALVGPNGAGKTTFLKTILAKMPPLTGEVVLGANLNVAYFAQAHEDLNPEKTLVEEIEAGAPQLLLSKIRDHLALFLFSGDEVFKKVSTLSGGERGRLALAKLSLTEANLLLLDEPTNHLDIPSQEILQEVLGNYRGTILLVSHDRYLIDALATQIWEIETGQANLHVFQGTYSQYRLHLETEQVVAENRRAKAVLAAQRSRRDRSSNEERRRRARLAEIESQIAAFERKLADLGNKLETPPSEAEQVQKMGEKYVQLQQEINTLLDEWETLHC